MVTKRTGVFGRRVPTRLCRVPSVRLSAAAFRAKVADAKDRIARGEFDSRRHDVIALHRAQQRGDLRGGPHHIGDVINGMVITGEIPLSPKDKEQWVGKRPPGG